MNTSMVLYSPAEAYPFLLSQILRNGIDSDSRAGKMREIEDFSVVFSNPLDSIHSPRKGFSPLLGAMEGAQLVGSFARPTLMDVIWPKYATYTDHWGDYGERLQDGFQIPKIIDALKDSTTRRAVLALWNPIKDARGDHLDHPCTLNIGFRIRGDKLNMSVTMRSNDIWRGSSSDFIQFTMLQATLATLLGVGVGTYAHSAYSMHAYHSDFEVMDEYLATALEKKRERHYGWEVSSLALPGDTYEDAQKEAANSLKATSKLGEMKTPMGMIIQSNLRARRRKLEGQSSS